MLQMTIQITGQSLLLLKSLNNIALLGLAFIIHLAYHLKLTTYWLFTPRFMFFNESLFYRIVGN